MRLGFTLVATASLAAALALHAPSARACGGCFPPSPPPGEQQSIVTDHRMILSVSKNQTTLYDQIQYTGAPESFAWVLPISGVVDVGLSADTVFSTLHSMTATVVQAPPTGCPQAPRCGWEDDARESSAGASNDASPPAVDVLKQEVVGPYETVQLRSTDPNALTEWLTAKGFQIPQDIQPVISSYVAEKFDFLALRLVPGQGVNSMRPVRITTPGASAVLPLRMVAAGTGASVGITLWVLGEGRYEPQNFQSFAIASADLTWDWTTGTSDYKDLRAARATALGGKGWEIESSTQLQRFQFENFVRNTSRFTGQQGTGGDYAPIEQDGQVVKTADTVREEDLATLFNGIAAGRERVTRIRADLVRAALAADLSVVASNDQAILPNVRTPVKEKGQPTCTVYNGCESVGTAPRDQAIAQTNANNGGNESFACATAPAKDRTAGGLLGFGSAAAFVASAIVRARRAKRREM